MPLSSEQKKLYKTVDEILWNDWDPIPVPAGYILIYHQRKVYAWGLPCSGLVPSCDPTPLRMQATKHRRVACHTQTHTHGKPHGDALRLLKK